MMTALHETGLKELIEMDLFSENVYRSAHLIVPLLYSVFAFRIMSYYVLST